MDDLSPAAAGQPARLDDQMAEVKRRADRAAQLRDWPGRHPRPDGSSAWTEITWN